LDRRVQSLSFKDCGREESSPKGKGCLLVMPQTRSQNPRLQEQESMWSERLHENTSYDFTQGKTRSRRIGKYM